jgi:AP-3 complex subunit beta
MMSKGHDVSELYPDVVKNVVCPNMVVKRLVYMYIVHYAELEPDPALLAINNFQRDMQNDNPLIRALGLRVMSSIRLRVIVQVVVLAAKKASKDGSPYVRKAAAHSLPKVYRLVRTCHKQTHLHFPTQFLFYPVWTTNNSPICLKYFKVF